ncbi:MAG: hypothetical protein K2J64_05930 [Desulfovibrio sp.]|nr:hypothetical protein [Desulfovibrio sp.]
MSHDFRPLPSWPGYTVSRQGIVRGKIGPLSVDRSGRVSLRETGSKRFRKVYIGEALADAGLLAEAQPPQAALVEAELTALRAERDAARSDLAALSGRIQEAQRVNRHNRSLNAALWARLRSLEAELAQIADRGRKEARVAAERAA